MPVLLGHSFLLRRFTLFALWLGQLARVMQGHHLRSNQYLVVRVYDEAEALAHNRKLRQIAQKHKTDFVENQSIPKAKKASPLQQERNIEQAGLGLISDTSS